jgi:oligopeptide/dipeptide ABC transporter ATP-binding protein
MKGATRPKEHLPQLVVLDDLSKRFYPQGSPYFEALSSVSLALYQGETFGLVGESGSGKSTLGRIILRLASPTGGKVYFEGRDVFSLRGRALLDFRKKAQVVFQDPKAALNPRMRVGAAIEAGVALGGIAGTRAKNERVDELLEHVGLQPSHAKLFPHELSGGQLQRVCLARALGPSPKFLVLDEPTSSLDVSIQAQILNLLLRLKRELGLTYLFISHDLAVVRVLSDRVGVLYKGRLVELAPAKALFKEPLHPYTRALLTLSPEFWDASRTTPSPAESEGDAKKTHPECAYLPLCEESLEACKSCIPELHEASPGHFVACQAKA